MAGYPSLYMLRRDYFFPYSGYRTADAFKQFTTAGHRSAHPIKLLPPPSTADRLLDLYELMAKDFDVRPPLLLVSPSVLPNGVFFFFFSFRFSGQIIDLYLDWFL